MLLHLLVVIAVGATAVPAAAVPLRAAAPQLVVNGSFSVDTTAPWWHTPGVSTGIDAGRLRVDVPAGTSNVWDVLVGQSGVPATGGTRYTLSFDASASMRMPVHTRWQREAPPHTALMDERVTLTTQPQHFTFSLTAGASAPDGQLIFQLGGQATEAVVFLDNISLTPKPGGSPIEATTGFHVWQDSNPARWVREHSGDPRATPIRDSIAARPTARWFGREWEPDVRSAVRAHVSAAAAVDKLPILVSYNIVGRDCGNASSGGARTGPEYRAWVSDFAAAIGDRPAIVIIEPDALSHTACVDDTRLALLQYAAEQFGALPNTWAYLDAGNANWPGVDQMAARLPDAGLSRVHGFAVNVSNFYTTRQSIDYATALNGAMVRNAPFVVDTSRNGNGPGDTWCNPPGRGLGTPPQLGGGAEALLWIKVPGDSDGNTGPDCDPATPPAGTFDPDLAMRLIAGTSP